MTAWRIGELGGSGAKRKALVVEDSAFNRALLCNILKESYDVIEAENGLVGLEQLDRHCDEISIILLDVYMPECDGFEFLRRKRTDPRFDTVPVIVTTASSISEDEIRCLELGANDFVKKPYDSRIIMNRVGNMVHLRESASMVNRLKWDEATGLYTRQFFYDTVEEALTADPGCGYDMVCCVVDNYKSLCDRYGEPNCTQVLHELAVQLTAMLPDLVTAGRISDEAFAFLVSSGNDWQDVLGSAAEGLSYPNVNAKFGIVERVEHTMDVPRICDRAMSAVDTVRGRHDAHIAMFDDELHNRQQLEQTIRECMEEALGGLQFSVFFQPKHDVHTNRIGGAEALVRWSHPTLGFISPGLFIPIFERNGFITELDLFVWEEACKEIARCTELGLPVVPISVNASRIDFDMPDMPACIERIADKHGVDHSLLHVEITETAYSDNPEAVIETLTRIKELGFSTELDDFGAGYSSLASLNTLPLDVMKLDMSMIRKATELDDFRIVESAIKLAQLLGLSTVVEGVETAEEAQRVTEIGCDMIQGYYYSKPLMRDDFEEYLAR